MVLMKINFQCEHCSGLVSALMDTSNTLGKQSSSGVVFDLPEENGTSILENLK